MVLSFVDHSVIITDFCRATFTPLPTILVLNQFCHHYCRIRRLIRAMSREDVDLAHLWLLPHQFQCGWHSFHPWGGRTVCNFLYVFLMPLKWYHFCASAIYDLPVIDTYFLRHLRFLIKSAEDMLKYQPSIVDLQNQASVTQTEIKAIRTELAATTQKQGKDHASIEEEKDGRLNAGWGFCFNQTF